MPESRISGSTALNDWLRRQLFENIPYNIAVIDPDFNIVIANDNFLEYFGDWHNQKCYAVYKKRKRPCRDCPTMKVFEDGRARVVDAVGVDQHGRQAHYIVHSVPLRKNEKSPVEYVIEMSSDVTETNRWQQEYSILFDRVPCFITVIDEEYRIVRANESFREHFGDKLGHQCYEVYKRRKSRCKNCPAARTFKDGRVHRSNQIGISKQGKELDYAVTTSSLMRGGDRTAHVIEISTDVTELKGLESKVIESERLAAVGQTVAGLAHSIKNILMGLDGGKYLVGLGLEKNDKEMIDQGWEMLERNFDKTTTLVKDFLSFSKGRLPELKLVNPNDLVSEIIDLYKEIASRSGIELVADLEPKLKDAPLDPDAIHTCLTNLVSNAIDACQLGDQRGSEVKITTRDERGLLIIEVSDNGSGMDYDIKQKIFTTFFTTKGGGGTGLGLLTTRKIIQEHGGKIIVESKPGEGARFRMEFPRKRLQMLYRKSHAVRELAREHTAGE